MTAASGVSDHADAIDDLRAARLATQGLTRRDATSPEAVVRRILAVQAQDLRGARLAVRSRSVGLTSADVDEAFTERRSLVVTWLQRGTLHLVASEDFWWQHALTAPRMATGIRRRLGQEGVSEAQAATGIDVITGAIASDGPQSRAQLQQHLDAAGVPTAGQALVHVLSAAAAAGRIVRGPIVDGEHAFVDPVAWIGPPPREHLTEEGRAELLGRLAARYVDGHGPADERDLVKWSGLPLGDARRGFAQLGEAAPLRDDGLRDRADRERPDGLPSPRLLGAFDPILHGWASREMFVGEHSGVVTSNGVFRATALVEGRTVATWSVDRQGLVLRPFEAIDASNVEALERDATDVQRFLGFAERGITAVQNRFE
ncbi:MAG: winged helix DNA-binding domain-containing protein [Acidimicrobiales bacterium]